MSYAPFAGGSRRRRAMLASRRSRAAVSVSTPVSLSAQPVPSSHALTAWPDPAAGAVLTPLRHSRGQSGTSEGLNRDRGTSARLLRGASDGLIRSLLISTMLVSGVPLPALAGPTPTTTITPGGNHAPTMNVAPNATKIVTINAPNAAGVSNNTYTTFNVGTDGVILNNSNAIVNTQIAGYIDGNANLKQSGPSRLILNQVISSNPSTLAGFTEVAGSPAQVVIANPNGITCNGCGFINSPWATMTTGTPTMGANGGITGYAVDQGVINITGTGLNASGMRVDLFSRALTLNAGIWADTINTSIGAANVEVTPNQGDPITVTARRSALPVPAFGLDVAALGGMYANSIHLIGTEAGLGVRVDGTLASLENGFTLNNAGDVTLGSTGQIIGATTAAIQTTGAVNNGGRIYASSGTNITSGGTLTNNGLIGSGSDVQLSIGALALASTGTLAAGLDQTGKLSQPGSISITGTGTGVIALNGQTEASNDVTVHAGSIDLTGGTTQATNITLSTTGAITNSNTSGQVYASSTLAMTSASLTNQGLLQGETTSVTTGALDNSNGQIVSTGTLDLTAGNLVNTGGVLSGTKALTVTAASIDNDGGTLFAGQVASAATASSPATPAIIANLTISGGTVSNTTINGPNGSTGGAIEATGAVTLNVASMTGAGMVAAQGGDITGHAATSIVTGAGTWRAGGNISLAAGTLINLAPPASSSTGSGSSGSSGGDNSGSGSNPGSGHSGSGNSGSGSNGSGDGSSGTGTATTTVPAQVDAGDTLTLIAPILILDNATLQAGRAISLDTPSLSASGTLLTQSGTGAFTLSATSGLNLAGAQVITAGSSLTVNAPNLTLQGGAISYNGSGALTFAIDGLLDASNKGDIVSFGTLSANVGSLDTSAGGALSAAQALTVNASGSLNNAGGSLISDGMFSLSTRNLANAGGTISGLGGLTVNTASIDNAGGYLVAGRPAQPATSSTAVDAVISDLSISNSGALNSASGTIAATGNGTVTAGLIDVGNGGQLSAGGALTATATGANGASGNILATAGVLGGGLIAAGGALSLAAAGVIDAHGSVAGAIVDNKIIAANGGTILAGATASLNAASLDLTDANAAVAGFTLNVPVTQFTGSVIQQNGASDFAFDAGANALNLSHAIVLTNGPNATFSAAGLNAQGATIEHGGSGTLTLNVGGVGNVTGLLDASNKGLIATSGSLIANVASLDTSSGGALSAAQALTINASNGVNNASGSLISDGLMSLTATNLANAGGTISGLGGLSVNTASINNAGGYLVAGRSAQPATSSTATIDAVIGDLSITTSGALSSRNGTIASTGDGTVTAGSIDVGNAGMLSAGGRLTATATGAHGTTGNILADAGTLGGGLIAAGGALSLTAAGIIDAHGSVASGIVNGQLVAANGGTISSGGTASLNATGLNLTDGNASAANFSLKVPVAQFAGAVVQQNSTSDFTFDAGGNALNLANAIVLANGPNASFTAASLNAQGATIEHSGAGTLTFNVTGLLDTSNKGLVASSGNLIANVGSLDTSASGALSAAQALTINAGGSVNNASGSLISDAMLSLTATRLANAGGMISGLGGLAVTTSSIDNTGGSLIAGRSQQDAVNGNPAITAVISDLSITATGVLSSRDGTMAATGNGTVTAGSIDVGNDGQLSAGGTLTAKATGANGISGNILADAGALGGGLIASGGAMSLTAAGAIDAHGSVAGGIVNGQLTAANGGTISAGGAASLNAAGLNLTDGNAFASSFTLNVPVTQFAGSVIQQQSGTSDFTFDAGIHDLNLSNAIVLASGSNARFTAGNLNAQGATIEHAGSGTLTLDVTGLLDVSNNGLIASSGNLVANVGDLDTSTGGTLSAAQALTVNASGSLNNAGGSLIANGMLSLTATDLANVGGMISGLNGLTVNTASIDNTAGWLVAGRSAQAAANGNPAISAVIGDLSLTATGALSSRSGTIATTGNGTVTAGSIDVGNGGQLSAGGTLSATATSTNGTTGNILADAGALGGGLIAAGGAMSLTAAGAIDAHGSVAGRITNNAIIAANGGILSAGGTTSLNAARLDLTDANASAAGFTLNVPVTLFAGSVIQQNGTSDFAVDAGTNPLNVSNAIVLANGANASFTAASLNAQGATIEHNGAGTLTFNVAGLLDTSTNGLITTSGSLVANVGSLDNAQGYLNGLNGVTVTTASIDNTGGTLFAGRSAQPAANGNPALDAVISDLSLTTSSAISSNNGVLAATGNANVTAAAIDVGGSNGRLFAGGTLNATATSGNIAAEGGQISAAMMTLTTAASGAATIDISHGGLISGGRSISPMPRWSTAARGRSPCRTCRSRTLAR